MADFEDYEAAQLRIPNRGDFGLLLASTSGATRDEELALLRVALLSRLPSRCPVDALGFVGEALNIERYAADTDDSYRARLATAFPTWTKAGSPGAIEDQIRAFGIPDVQVHMAHELAFLPASPIGYDPGRSPPWYSAFIVKIGPNFGSTGIAPQRAPFVAGPQCTSGSTATRDQVAAICRIILKWKSAHSYPVGVLLHFAGACLGGITTTAPFTPPAEPLFCFWNLGKLQGVNIFNGPFTPGGYEY